MQRTFLKEIIKYSDGFLTKMNEIHSTIEKEMANA